MGPCFKVDKESLEKMQRRVTKMTRLTIFTNEKRLRQLGLLTLKYRRTWDMNMLYKILTSKVRSEDELVGLKHNIRQTRGQSLQIAKVRTIRKVGRNYISTRSCDKWNRLPQRVTSAKIVQTFKTRLGEFLKSEWFEV